MTKHSLSDSSQLINLSPVQPRIYIACLTSHLAGKVYGDWVNANQSTEALEEAAKHILASSPAGVKALNWIILNAEGFSPLKIGPYTSLKTISLLATFIVEQTAL